MLCDLTPSLFLNGKNINMRLVEIEDAPFILQLRLDEGKILSPTENSLENQIKWLCDYKKREAEKREYYFMIESKNSSRLGTARIYDLQDYYFWLGSWVMGYGSPFGAAFESLLIMYKFGFYTLRMSKSYSNIKSLNEPVIKSQLRLGARIVGRDNEMLYFELARPAFEKAVKRYGKYSNDV